MIWGGESTMGEKSFKHISYILISVLAYLIYDNIGINILWSRSLDFLLLIIFVLVYGFLISYIFDYIVRKDIDIRIAISFDFLITYLFALAFNSLLVNKIPIIIFLIPVFIKNFKRMRNFKYLLLILISISIVVGLYMPIREYNKPYEAIEGFIIDVENGAMENNYLVTDDEFTKFTSDHFSNVKMIDMEELEKYITGDCYIRYKVKSPLRITLRPKSNYIDYTLEYLSFYDKKTAYEVKSYYLVVAEIDGEWKVVGEFENKSSQLR